MRTSFLQLSRDEIRRLLFLKTELKLMLLKSIRHNQQTKPLIRYWTQYKIQRHRIFLSRQINYCILTGHAGGVYKISQISRQMMNKNLQKGYITNIRNNNIK